MNNLISRIKATIGTYALVGGLYVYAMVSLWQAFNHGPST